MKRILLVAAVISCAATAAARDLVILHTNDTHSHIDPLRTGPEAGMGGVIERAVYIDSVRTAVGRKNMLLLDAGDFSQGSSYFSLLNGDVEVELMNAMRYDASCLGNHEFDNGLDELARRCRMAKYDIVCANYDFSGTPLEKCVKPYTVIRRAGRKIGIIGLLTDVSDVVDGDIAEHLKYIDPAAVTNGYAAVLKEKGCDLVVVLSHLGYREDLDLAKSICNVDVIIGGHSHTFVEASETLTDVKGNPVAVVQDGCWGLYVGNMTVGEK